MVNYTKSKNKNKSKKLTKKKSQFGGNPKIKLYIGYLDVNNISDSIVKKYLEDNLFLNKSNTNKNHISILFSNSDKNKSIYYDDSILNSRNCINNLVNGIKFVEYKFSNGLFYRKNKESNIEENLRKTQDIKSLDKGSIKDIYENSFKNPLYGIKKIDNNNLNVIMYPLPKDKDDNKYDIKLFNKLLESNSKDYFVVLFPSLIEKKKTGLRSFIPFASKDTKNDANISSLIKEIKMKKIKSIKGNDMYNYGVYVKNADNFNIEVVEKNNKFSICV